MARQKNEIVLDVTWKFKWLLNFARYEGYECLFSLGLFFLFTDLLI